MNRFLLAFQGGAFARRVSALPILQFDGREDRYEPSIDAPHDESAQCPQTTSDSRDSSPVPPLAPTVPEPKI